MLATISNSFQFRAQIRETVRKQTLGCRILRVGKHQHVYTTGERDGMVYFIESGKVKLVQLSPEGKECLLSIRAAGDLFGELCLSGQIPRSETAIVMQDAIIKQIPCRSFLTTLKQESLLEGLVQYLAYRIAEQQEVIATLATENSEQRLAKTLLQLGKVFGRNDTCGTHIQLRISHEELSEMVGTTRPRIGIFLKKFRELGMIRLNAERALVIDEMKLEDYLIQNVFRERPPRDSNPVTKPGNLKPMHFAAGPSGN